MIAVLFRLSAYADSSFRQIVDVVETVITCRGFSSDLVQNTDVPERVFTSE